MHELAGAKRNTDVRGAPAHRLEKNQIARADLIAIHPFALVVLFPRFTRERCAVLPEHPLDEPAAVEASCRLGPSVQIRGPAKRQRRRDQRGRRAFHFGRCHRFRGRRRHIGAGEGLRSWHTATARAPAADRRCEEQRNEPEGPDCQSSPSVSS